jgi:hypothetical protein
MSLDFIHTFQLKILNNLETLVREHVNQVYISVIEDGNYPFISINLVKLENYSKALQFIYLLSQIWEKNPALAVRRFNI